MVMAVVVAKMLNFHGSCALDTTLSNFMEMCPYTPGRKSWAQRIRF